MYFLFFIPFYPLRNYFKVKTNYELGFPSTCIPFCIFFLYDCFKNKFALSVSLTIQQIIL